MHPVITLTTDFGLGDSYVAAMKAVLLRYSPQAHLIDITHLVPRHDLVAGSFLLQRAIAQFDPGTVHLAVVDPGVGTRRPMLIARLCDQWIVCPDNGLITWATRLHKTQGFWRLTWRPRQSSKTFHGRDIMAPVAGLLASGGAVASVGRKIRQPVFLDMVPAHPPRTKIRVIHIDAFGNATTNLLQQRLRILKPKSVSLHGIMIGPVRQTYGDVPCGRPLALVGSSGLLEIAVREGSAENILGIRVGDEVTITC